MLRSHLAASLIHLIERHNGRLALPEVVAVEIEAHAVAEYRKAVKQALSTLGRIRMIIGRSPDPTFPSEDAASEALSQRREELRHVLFPTETQDRHFLAAAQMVLTGSPPNSSGSQQFKDCVLWQAVLDLVVDYNVLLVTADGGFYADSKGDTLTPALAPGTGDAVILCRSMEAAVCRLQENAPVLDLAPILDAIDESLRPQVDEIAQDAGFTV